MARVLLAMVLVTWCATGAVAQPVFDDLMYQGNSGAVVYPQSQQQQATSLYAPATNYPSSTYAPYTAYQDPYRGVYQNQTQSQYVYDPYVGNQQYQGTYKTNQYYTPTNYLDNRLWPQQVPSYYQKSYPYDQYTLGYNQSSLYSPYRQLYGNDRYGNYWQQPTSTLSMGLNWNYATRGAQAGGGTNGLSSYTYYRDRNFSFQFGIDYAALLGTNTRYYDRRPVYYDPYQFQNQNQYQYQYQNQYNPNQYQYQYPNQYQYQNQYQAPYNQYYQR